MGVDGNAKATTVPEDNHINILIEAAKKLRDLVKQMENLGENIKGYIIYSEDTEEEKKKKMEDSERAKKLMG
jgi:hypothetical protein